MGEKTLDNTVEIGMSLNNDNDFTDIIEPNLKVSFQNVIAIWVLQYCLPLSVLNELLKILRLNGHPSICVNSKTLLKTPSFTISRNISGGQYTHFSIVSEINRLLK